MKMYLTTALLCAAIVLIALGIHTNSLILVGIGSSLSGLYNAMMYKQDKEK